MPVCGREMSSPRLFDTMACGLGVVLAVLFIPSVGKTPFGDLGNVHVLPVAVIGAAVLLLFHGQAVRPADAWLVWRLRASALCMAGFSTFLSWWLRFADNSYLVAAGSCAVGSFLWCQIELTVLLEAAAGRRPHLRLRRLSRLVRQGLVFGYLVPVLAYLSASLVLLATDDGTSIADLSMWWYIVVPGHTRMLAALPLLGMAWLLLSAGPALGPGWIRDFRTSAHPPEPGEENANG